MRISLVLLFLSFASPALAQELAGPSPTPSAKPAPKAWALALESKYQFSLHSADDANKRASLQALLKGAYSFSDEFKVQGAFGGVQAFRPSLDFKVINPEFRGFYLLSDRDAKLKIAVGPYLALPFGTDAKDESLIFGAGAGGRATLNLTKKDGSGFKGFYDLVFNKNFHQFETSVFAEVNTQYALSQTVYLEYNFDSQWNLNATLSFSSLWSYFGYLSNNYSSEQELDFQASDLVTLFIAHVRGGDILSPNGQNYSFGIFSQDSSRVSLGIALSF